MMKGVQRMEEMGVIQPSKSDWASPVVMVPKNMAHRDFVWISGTSTVSRSFMLIQ